MSEISVQKGDYNQISQKSNGFLFDGEKVIMVIPDIKYYNRAARISKKFSNWSASSNFNLNKKYGDATMADARKYHADAESMAFKGDEVKRSGNLIITDKRFIVGKSATDFSRSNMLLSMNYDPETIKKEIAYISMNNREAMGRLKDSDLKLYLKGRSSQNATKFGFIASVSAINSIEIGKYLKSMNVNYSTVGFSAIERKYHLRLEPDDYYLPKIKALPPLPRGATKQQIKDRKKEEKKMKKDVKSLEKYKNLLKKNQGDTTFRKGALYMIDKNKIITQKQVLNFILPEKKQKSEVVEEVAKRINSGKDYLNNIKQVEQEYIASRLMRK